MKRDWKAEVLSLPVRRGDMVLPLDTRQSTIHLYATRYGVTIMIRRRPDGYHVWRLA